jgi:hypothetical protein
MNTNACQYGLGRPWIPVLFLTVLLASITGAFAQTIYQRHLNLNFGSGTNIGPAAFTGGSTNQPWNIVPAASTVSSNYTYYGTTNTVPVITYDAFTNFVWATGSNAPVTVTITNLLSVGHNNTANVMFDSFLYASAWLVVDDWNEDLMDYVSIPADPKVAIDYLPAGTYDLYVYGAGWSYYDGEGFRVKIGTNAPTSWKSTSPPDPLDTNWTENTHYVLFTNLVVGTNETMLIELAEGYEYDLINGLQIIDLASTNPPTLPSVTFDPPGGNILPANVTLSVPGHNDATIYYTTDGSTPTTNSSVYSSAISLTTPTTLKAFGVKTGYTDSETSSANYHYPILPGVAFNPLGGSYLMVNPTPLMLSVPGHTNAIIYYTLDGSSPTTSSSVYSAPIQLTHAQLAWTGNRVPAMTSYTTPAGNVVTFSTEKSGTTDYAWKAFDHSVATETANHWQANSAGPEWVTFEFPSSRIIARYALVSRANSGDAPRAWTLEAWNGESYVVLDTRTDETNWLALERREYVCTNSGLYAKYRLNVSAGNASASNPNTNIVVGELEMFEIKMTVTAFATEPGHQDSQTTFADYHAPPSSLLQIAPTPFVSPAGGDLANSVAVTLSTSLSGGTIRYSTNGTDWVDYTDPLLLDGGPVSLLARTIKDQYEDSAIRTNTYVFAVAETTFTPPPGNFTNSVQVALPNATTNALVQYRINESALTDYTGPITLTDSTLLTAVATKPGYSSRTNTGSYISVPEIVVWYRQLNLNFGSGTNLGMAAFPGATTNDVWNLIPPATTVASNYTYYGTTNTVPVITYDAFTNFVWATGIPAPVTVTITNLLSVGHNSTANVMFDSFLYANAWLVEDDWNEDLMDYVSIPADPAVAIRHLPAGTYDLYVYGNGSSYLDGERFRARVGTNPPSAFKSTGPTDPPDINWTENAQYVLFTNLIVGTNETVLIELDESYNYDLINGVQIVDLGSTNAPPPQLPDVVFDPASGAAVPVNVALSVPGYTDATIYYTSDGSSPTTNSTVYSSAISITVPTTIKAFARRPFCVDSAVSTANYVLPTAPVPSVSPDSGTYHGPVTVTISNTLQGASLEYSHDTTNWIAYTAPFIIDATTNLWARALKEGYQNSPLTTRSYVFSLLATTISPASGLFTNSASIALSNATENAVLAYSLDAGATWVGYTNAFELDGLWDGTGFIFVSATKPGYSGFTNASGVYSFTALPPVFSHASGSYTNDITVTLTTATAQATIEYSFNDVEWFTYGSGLVLSNSTKLIARTVRAGYLSAGHVQYSASGGFSAVQGLTRWSYLYSTQPQGLPDSFLPLYDLDYGVWRKTDDVVCLVAPMQQHPGQTNDSIRSFVVPVAGELSVTGTAILEEPGETVDGVIVRVLCNDTNLTGWVTLNATNSTLSVAQTVSVQAGDYLHFQVSSGGNSAADLLHWDPVITFENARTYIINDRDADGLTDAQELALGTDPDDPDTDGDGVSDHLEYLQGRNPLVAGIVADTSGAVRLVTYTPLEP